MKAYLMDIGEGNSLAACQVLAILRPGSAPSQKLKAGAKAQNLLVDATGGQKTRSLVITVSNHLILSNQEPEELTRRLNEIFSLAEN